MPATVPTDWNCIWSTASDARNPCNPGTGDRLPRGGLISSTPDIDAIAAALRADTADSGLLLDVVAMKLEDALPDLTEVRRHGPLNRSKHRVKELEVAVDEHRFTLKRERHHVVGTITHVVHGIDLSTKRVDVDEWLTVLSEALAKLAAGQARAREALDRLLLGR
jgi:hypothetical protein